MSGSGGPARPAGLVALTRLEAGQALLDGAMFPAQHMAENDKGAPTEQAQSPPYGEGVVPGLDLCFWRGVRAGARQVSKRFSCTLGVPRYLGTYPGGRGLVAANLFGPLIPGQLVA